LDSFNALSVVKTLADLAHDHGKTVIFTIHQPRSDVFTLFDQILIMKRGSPLYCGPGNLAGEHLKKIGKACPEGYNMADHLLDLASMDDLAAKSPLMMLKDLSQANTLGIKTQESSVEFARVTAMNGVSQKPSAIDIDDNKNVSPTSETPILSHHEADLDDKTGQELSEAGMLMTVNGCDSGKPIMSVSFLTQTTVLMGRAQKNLIRTPSLLLAHVILSIVLGGKLGHVFSPFCN
jgi:hypothetical protein